VVETCADRHPLGNRGNRGDWRTPGEHSWACFGFIVPAHEELTPEFERRIAPQIVRAARLDGRDVDVRGW
jgi:hypothetical protein